MPYCPNPECPFRKRFGESAEYRLGTATCSDCGAVLSDIDVLGPAPTQPRKRITFTFTDTHKRIAWTLILVAFWRISSHISLPGIDFGPFSSLIQGNDSLFSQLARLGIFSLGLTAYVSSYVITEILALFIQPLKGWRLHEGQEGRVKLARTARALTLIIGLYHANALVTSIASMAGGSMLVNDGPGIRSLLVLTLVAGLFLMVWIADMISARGMGHGVSILFLASELGGLPRIVAKLLSLAKDDSIKRQVMAPFLVLVGLIVLIIVVEKMIKRFSIRTKDGTMTMVPVKLTTAGTIPSEWAGFFIGLPMIIMGFIPPAEQAKQPLLEWFTNILAAGSVGRFLSYGAVLFVLYYVFTAFFHDPKKILVYSMGQTTGDAERVKMRAMDRSLEGMALIGSLYLFLLASIHDILWYGFGLPFILDGLTLLLVVCIILDLINEAKLRRRAGEMTTIAELHEPWKAGMMQSLLQEKGIPCLIRGYHHRALLYFFGPYIEMSLFVPREQAAAAQDVLAPYLTAAEPAR